MTTDNVLNGMRESDRIQVGKGREAILIERLNSLPAFSINGETVHSFVPSTDDEDIHAKVDAWGLTETGEGLSAQIKTRDTGTDLGIALIRPYINHGIFMDHWEKNTVRFDRDFKEIVDMYVCYVYSTQTLMVADGIQVHNLCVDAIEAFVADEAGFRGKREFSFEGGCLKSVRDQGYGYSGGEGKVICYISPRWIMENGGFIVENFEVER